MVSCGPDGGHSSFGAGFEEPHTLGAGDGLYEQFGQLKLDGMVTGGLEGCADDLAGRIVHAIIGVTENDRPMLQSKSMNSLPSTSHMRQPLAWVK